MRAVLRELRALRESLIRAERDDAAPVGDRDRAVSRRNLRHYVALRSRDVRDLQERLSRLGLSSLGRSEAHVLSSLDAVLRVLAQATGEPADFVSADVAPTFDEGRALLALRAESLLGPRPRHRRTRIMVTVGAEGVHDAQLVERLVEAGMDAVRINCGRDDATVWPCIAERVRAASRKLTRPCAVHVDLAGPKLRTCAMAEPIALAEGDRLLLTRRCELTRQREGKARESGMPVVGCTVPGALESVRAGHAVWFDDGKLGGVADCVSADGVVVRITYVRDERRNLIADRGINLPDSDVDVEGFTAKDRADLEIVADLADSVALSFAERPEDVRAVQARLAERGRGGVGIVLKIETRRGFEALPRLLLAHSGGSPLGVMIARGDLALDIGYERLSEVQEEILWLCEAAHVPAIWATQVLETLAKNGMPTRAEVTDAAMSGRAECVMLNKGRHIVDTVRTLDDILRRMEEHQQKKSSTLRTLHVSCG
jgi:pyruvate kinase